MLIYDKMMSEFDPKLVKMQYQTIVATLGIDAVEVFQKYPGRIVSLHLQDYVAGDKKMTAIGQGAIDWKKLFGAAKKAGVKNYYVEMSPELMQASVPYLRDLKV
jgi:sugar phosphate isomerase/epimerase